MLKVVNNEIYLTRGDTMQVELTLTNADGSEYAPVQGDAVYFRLRKGANDGPVLIEKSINTENMLLQLDPEDTVELAFGTYKYEIEVVTAENHHYTVIADTDFKVGKELEDHG